MSFLNPRFGYSKIDKEDPDEAKHRRAQFLIYKVMQQADSAGAAPPRRRPSWLKIRASRLRIRIGNRLRRLRKTISSIISGTEVGLQKRIVSQFRAFKRLVRSREDAMNVHVARFQLRPMFN